MKQTNYIEKKEKKNKISKRKLIVFGFLSILLISIGLVFILNFTLNKSNPFVKGNNYITLDTNNSTFEYRLIDNSVTGDSTTKGNYVLSDVSCDKTKYAQIIGVKANSTSMSVGDGLNLVFPDVITDNGIKYQVKEINCTVNTNGTTLSDGYRFFSSFNDLNNSSASFYTNNIKRIEVPKRVDFIEVGSFNGLGCVEELSLPFIGTTRGNQNTDGNMGVEGYKSALLSVFGFGFTLNGQAQTKFFAPFNYKVTYVDGTNAIIQNPSTPVTASSVSDVSWIDSGTTLWVSNGSNNDMTALYMPYYLNSVEITDEVYVASRAFFSMSLLENVSISFNTDAVYTNQFVNALTIGEYVFYQCYHLLTAKLPKNCTTIGTGIFANCYVLGGPKRDSAGQVIQDSNGKDIIGSVTMPDGLKTIPESMFANCGNLEEITIPKKVTTIGSKAFLGCSSLTKIKSSSADAIQNPGIITLPQTVTTIKDQAFRNCSSFTSFAVPSTVTSIGTMAFNGCSKLIDITLPFIGGKAGNSNSKDSLFGYIFGEYSELVDEIDEDVLSKTYQVVQTESGLPEGEETSSAKKHSFFIPESLRNVTILNETVVAPGAFMNCAKIKNIRILSSQAAGQLDTVSTIAEGAMYGCSGLEEITLPFVGQMDCYSSVNSLYDVPVWNGANAQLGYIFGKRLFSGTEQVSVYGEENKYWYIPSSLKTVSLNHQTTLPSYAFYNTTMIENVIVSNATLTTKRNVFYNCKSLTSLTLPFVGEHRGIGVSGDNSARNSYGYYEVYDYFWEDVSVRNSLVWLFAPMASYGVDVNGFYDNYYISGYWRYSVYAGRIPESLTDVRITNDTAIPSYAFRAFSSLQRITIDDTIVSDAKGLILIDSGCMTGCSNLTTLETPFIGRDYNNNRADGSAYTIGWYFGTSAYGNSYRASQAGYNYYIPKSLTRIKISGKITAVPAWSFANMTSVSSVALDGTIMTIGDYAFYCDNKLTIIDWPNARFTKVANYAFANCSSLGDMEKFVPSTVTDIGNYSFMGTSITGIAPVLNSKIKTIGNGAFKSCYQITKFDFNNYTALTSVGNYLFEDCGKLVDVENIRYLTDYMFKDCISLKGVDLNSYYTLPTSRTDLPEGLFYGCYNLLSPGVAGGLVFNNNVSKVDTIGAHAFKGCSSLTTFVFPESVIQIREGAFQNCSRLEKVRIVRNCTVMPAGTNKSTGIDNLTTGIFYGCNDDFYLEVYYQENDWPSTWEYNWNCYYPVMVIGNDSTSAFKYAYDDDLGGYVIIGFNTDSYNFVVTLSSGIKEYYFNDIVVFPSTYNGLPVKGIISGAFSGYSDNYFEKVDSFVLGEDYVEMGSGVLSFDLNHTIYVYSQMTVAQAIKNQNGVTASGKFIPETIGASVNSTAIEKYYGSGYGNENMPYNYMSNGIVFYKEAWRFVGTTPTIMMSALKFELEHDSYTYKMGDQITPVITGISSNNDCIRYVDKTTVQANQKDIIYDRFYDFKNGQYDTKNLKLDNVLVKYSNNINVGTATITFTSNSGFLYGLKTETFVITKYEVMLFNEANVSSDISKEYQGYDSYTSIFNDYLSSNNTNIVEKAIIKTTYNGQKWSNSQWTLGNQLKNLPSNYSVSGTLRTINADAGQYVSEKVFGNGGLTGQGFEWANGYHIYNEKGQDVTSNFEMIITLFVEIMPYNFNDSNLRWDGTWNSTTSKYEYKYNGLVLSPKPHIYDEKYGEMDAGFNVIIDPVDAIDPGTTGTMTILSYSSNFTYNGAAGQTFTAEFEIVKGEINITVYSQYTLDENNNYYRYSGGFSSWTNTPPTFQMEITGVGPNSILNGELITTSSSVFLEKGLYSSDTSDSTRKGDFTWDPNSTLINGNTHNTGYYIVSSTRFTNDADQSLGYMDETDKYNVTLNASCEIKYSTIKYYLSVTENVPHKHVDGSVTYDEETISIDDSELIYRDEKNFTNDDIASIDPLYIKYGVDGYEHKLGTIFYNNFVNDPTVSFIPTDSTTGSSTYTFKDTGTYSFVLKIEKQNYETVIKNIQLVLVNGLFKFAPLDKEYDREPINVINALLRRPYDLDSNVTQEFKFYDKSTGNELSSAPSTIGSYKVKIKMTGSQYFNDYDDTIDFVISRRSLIIKVDEPVSSKEYDGQPWTYNPGESGTGDTKSSLNLLNGDSLFGSFKSISSAVKLYKSDNGDFYVDGAWRVANDILGDQTSNYNIVFKGDFEILAKQFKYKLNVDWSDSNKDASGTYVFNYDGGYHYATIKVTEPTSNYHVYYSDQNPENGAKEVDWSVQPYFYSQPNSGSDYYTTYVKLVADNYETKYDFVVIKITGKDVDIICEEQDRVFIHDGFEHTINVTTDPYYANVYYYLLSDAPDASNLDRNYYESVTDWSTTPPIGINSGSYHILVKATAPNYNTSYEYIIMEIKEEGTPVALTITGDNVTYDREMHGFTITNLGSGINIQDLTIRVAIDDGNKNWLNYTLSEPVPGSANYQVDLFTEAGDYNLYIEVLKPGYLFVPHHTTVHINPLQFDLGVNFYKGQYDGEYHSGILYSTSTGTDRLVITGSLATNNLAYQYAQIVNNVEKFIPLTVEYGVVGPNNQIVYSTSIARFKDVTPTTPLYIRVSGENFKTKEFSGTIEILKATNIQPTYKDDIEIEYLARPITYDDLGVDTFHDGQKTIFYYDATDSNSTPHNHSQLGQRTAPQDLGVYFVEIRWADTSNCELANIGFYFHIVPRVLTVEYDEEYEYTGGIIQVTPTITTGTTDVVDYSAIPVDSVGNTDSWHIIPGTYYFKLQDNYNNPNYELSLADSKNLEYRIINRKVYVSYEDSLDYTANLIRINADYTSSTANSDSDQGFNVTGLLAGDRIKTTLETRYASVGTYTCIATYTYTNGTWGVSATSGNQGLNLINLDIKDVASDSDELYYDVVFDIKLTIKFPNLDVEYDDTQVFVFDGFNHLAKIEVKSKYYGVLKWQFWTGPNMNPDPSDIFVQNIPFRNVGTYSLNFIVEADQYNKFQGQIKIVIKSLTLSCDIDPFTGIYDGTGHTTSFTINTQPINLNNSEVPKLYYFKKSTLEENGYDLNSLNEFFTNGTQTTFVFRKLHQMYINDSNSMIDAGDYYAVLYYPFSQSGESNIEGILQIKEIRLEQRTLYFKTKRIDGTNVPTIMVNTYNGSKYEMPNGIKFVGNNIFDSEYDLTANSKNNLSYAGLLPGHVIGNHFDLYTFVTSSANARGNADGENHGDPYQAEGDFEFLYFEISASGVSVVDNYRPAFSDLDDGSYAVQITIKRAELKDFNVVDGEVEYNGYNIMPKYNTSSDGNPETLYVKTDSNYTPTDGVFLTDQTDVGYYLVYVHIAQGTNYKAWAGSNPTTDRDVYHDGKWYKKAKVHCTPKQVAVEWEETSTEYTGNDIYAKPYIIDVFGNRLDLQYELYDTNRTFVNYNAPMLNAGRYFTKALATHQSIANSDNYIFWNDTINFQVDKRVINIKYTTNEAWLKTNWEKTFTEDDIDNIIGFKDLFPKFKLELKLSTKAAKDGTYREASSFNIDAKVTDDHGNWKYSSGINIPQNGVLYVADNFTFRIGDGDVEVTLVSKDIKVNVSDTDISFDNQYHSPIVDVVSHVSGYDIQYKWGLYDDANDALYDQNAYDSQVWTSIVPRFMNVGTYYVGYKVSVAGEDGKENIEEGHVIIRIRQADAYLHVSNLNRTYTGISFNTSTIGISGGFNGDFLTDGGQGDKYSLLQFYFKKAGDPDTDYSLTLPKDAGKYVLKIVSQADGNPAYVQNYTTLDSIQNTFEFEITPATLTLNYNADLEVATDVGNTFHSSNGATGYVTISTGNLIPESYCIGQNNQNNVTNQVQLNGLLGSDNFVYNLVSNANLSRATYLYSNAVATSKGIIGSTQWNFYVNDLFTIKWKTTDDASSSNDNSYNYQILLKFKLKVHYPEMTVNEIPNVVVDYDGNPRSFVNEFKTQNAPNTSITNYVANPSSIYCNVKFSEKNSLNAIDYGSQDIIKTEPGIYTIYFMIEAVNAEDIYGNSVNFENYFGTVYFTINPKSRVDDGLKFADNLLNKIYDGLSYDGSTWNQIKNTSGAYTFGGSLPSNWSISYFVAKEQNQGTGDWQISGTELKTVSNAGDYIYRLKIPASGVYAETIIEKHFKIDRRKYHIALNNGDSKYEKIYTGSSWSYDLVSYLNDGTSDFNVQRQNNDEGLLDGNFNHKLIVALMISSNSIIGNYTQTGTNGVGTINIKPDFHVIVDINNNDVTENYDFIFDFGLEITKGTIAIDTNIPQGGIFTYDEMGGVTFKAWIVTPAGIPQGNKIQYREFNASSNTWGDWTTTTSLKKDVGTYRYEVKATDVPNFYDLSPKEYTFEIQKVRNSLTINANDKEYDGTPVDIWIATNDFTGTVAQAAASNVDVEVKYYEDNNGIRGGQIIGPTPKYAGTYWVTVKYGDTANFKGIEKEAKYTIYPRELTVSGYSTDLIYNADEQAPNFVIRAKTGDLTSFSSKDYEVYYYDQSNLTNVLSGKTKNVGNYRLVIKLKGTGEASPENNYTFADDDKEFIINYTISKCTVIFKVAMNYKFDANNPPIIDFSKITSPSDGKLPTGVQLDSYIIARSSDAKQYLINCSYTHPDFVNNFKWNNTPDTEPLLTKNGVKELLDNYDIRLDINLNVAEDTIPYTVTPYAGVYDGEKHSITFIYGDSADTSVEIRYSTKATTHIDDYSTTLPQFKNYTVNPYHVYVAIKSTKYTQGNWVFLGLDSTAPDYESFTVKIAKAATSITPPNIDLNKIYDGKVTPNPANIDYISYGGDNLDDKLTYTYYVKQGNAYAECNSVLQNRTNVGEYYLIISLEFESGDNYTNSSTDPIYFEIKPRDVVIKIPNQVKTYDGTVWSAVLASSLAEAGRFADATFEKVVGVTESGLVDGQDFIGTLMTKSVNSGYYYGGIVGSTLSDLVWKSGYKFYQNSNKNDVILSTNYNLIVETTITIDLAELDIEFADITHIYTGQEYFITHVWKHYPVVSGYTSIQDYDNQIKYTIDPLGHGAPASSWSNTPIGCKFGSLTVYIMIEMPNYKVFKDTRTITITSLPSHIDILDWGSFNMNPDDMVYNGTQYSFNDIQMKSDIAGDTRIPYLKYYQLDDNGDYVLLTDAPVNAGKYAITFCLDADMNNGYDAYESLKQPFEIKKAKVQVFWASQKWEKDPVTGKITYKMFYTGSVTTPIARAYGVLYDIQNHLEIIPLNVTISTNGTYNGISVGTQKVKATIQPGTHPNPQVVNGLSQANYEQNYYLVDDECEYQIIASYDLGGNSNVDPTFPDPGNHPNHGDPTDKNNPTNSNNPNNPDNGDTNSKFEGIKFELKQYDPIASTANKPYVYSSNLVLYFTVTYLYSDGTTKVYYYEIEPVSLTTAVNTKLTIKTIYDINWNPIDTNPSCKFDFVLKETVKTSEFEVDAVLKDNVNYSWNSAGNNADCPIKVQLDPLEITDYINDITLTNPTSGSLLLAKDVNGNVIKTVYDQTSADQKTIVTIRGGLVGSQTNIVLEYSDGAFDIFYGNNMKPTTSNPNENAYYVVKSKDSYPISFVFGDYDTYKSVQDANSSNPDYMNQNKMPTTTPPFEPAFTFEIKTPEPTYLQLTNTSSVKFVSYEQDFDASTLTYTFDVSNDDRYNALSAKTVAERKDSIYKLSHLPQMKDVSFLLSGNFVNDLKYIAVYTTDGTALFDGSSGADLTNVPSDYIGTGMYIVLYDSDDTATRVEIDCVEIVVVGDVDGSGTIETADIAQFNIYISTNDDLLLSDLTSAKYLASLLGDVSYVETANVSTMNIYLQVMDETSNEYYLDDILYNVHYPSS